MVVASRSPLARLTALAVVLLAALDLVGWVFQIDLLTRFHAGLASMKPMTAVAFLFAARSLYLLDLMSLGGPAEGRRRRGARICGTIAGLLGLAELLEHVFQLNFGIDNLLFSQAVAFHGETGHMPPATAWAFLVAASSLLLTDFHTQEDAEPAQFLAVVIILFGIISTAGYIYGTQGLERTVAFASLSLNTAICFLLLGAGIFFVRPKAGIAAVIASGYAGGWMARRILPITTLLPFVIAYLRTRGESAGLYERELGLAMFSTANIFIMAVIIWANARALNRIDARRRETDRQVNQTALALNRSNAELQKEVAQRVTAETQLRQANESLESKVGQRTALLQESNRELESFSYSVSHDLRSPLRSIDGFSKLLMDSVRPRLTETETSYLERVMANAERMGRLIEGLLSLSRITRSNLHLTQVDLSALAGDIIRELREADPTRHVEAVVEPGLTVSGDESLLRSVLVNLLNNAWKFTRQTTEPRVVFGQKTGVHGPIYYVQDNGAGFNMDYAHQLFGPFQRLHRADEFEGHGIGLATAQRIILRHGGRMWAEGKPALGATFFFAFENPGLEKMKPPEALAPEGSFAHSEVR